MQVGQLIMYYTPKKVLPFAFFKKLFGGVIHNKLAQLQFQMNENM